MFQKKNYEKKKNILINGSPIKKQTKKQTNSYISQTHEKYFDGE